MYACMYEKVGRVLPSHQRRNSYTYKSTPVLERITKKHTYMQYVCMYALPWGLPFHQRKNAYTNKPAPVLRRLYTSPCARHTYMQYVCMYVLHTYVTFQSYLFTKEETRIRTSPLQSLSAFSTRLHVAISGSHQASMLLLYA